VHCLGRPKEAFRRHGSTEFRSEHIRPQDFGRSGQQVPDLERAAAPAHLRQRAVAPERVIPDSLIVAHDRTLPKLPELRAAIFARKDLISSATKRWWRLSWPPCSRPMPPRNGRRAGPDKTTRGMTGRRAGRKKN